MKGNSNEQALLVVSPKKENVQRACCMGCSCYQFQSDEAVTSAVNSDARMEALMSWLAGATADIHERNNISFTDETDLCPNRLQASIVILNAIRDACRPYLDTSGPLPSSPMSSSSCPFPLNAKNVQPSFNENPAYEDYFPPLPSPSSNASAPTILLGRKGHKKKKTPLLSCEDSFPPLSSASSAKNTTMLFGRKKCKGSELSKGSLNLGNRTATSDTNDLNEAKMGAGANKNRITPKVKKKIKPVTISFTTLSSSSTLGVSIPEVSNSPKSFRLEGNISSLPSVPTSEMLGTTAIQLTYQVENESAVDMSSVLTNVCFTENKSPSTDVAPKIKKESTVGAKISSSNPQKMKRLVLIYSTILRAHLAPFRLLELHLLVRLVSLSDESDTCKPTNTIQQFSDIFQSKVSCRAFAAQTLTALDTLIVNMGHETVKMFASVPAIKRHCPELCMTLKDIISAGNSALIFEADQKAFGSNTTTPHLTLPFEHARDSRHNYRSVDRNRLFKEREELRDSFLYQLRAFQDIRGKLMDEEHTEIHIGSIRNESRDMLKKLSSGNTLWFVNFFCDLLLQIGLVPIGETDSEVLKQIDDKRRLQKLHMRFTSKIGQTNKSCNKLLIDQGRISAATNAALLEQSFHGHQEFFSTFLRAGDSYKFNVHLKRRLAQIITEMAAVNETKGLCGYIAKTQMLAKFLGLLVFSPNWDLSSVNATADLSSEKVDIRLPPVNVKECVEQAWERSRLVAVIPWVVQFLSMMKWDDASRRCQYYVDTFALLRSINHHCLPYQIDRHSYYTTNMTLLSLQLESLFYDTVGLAPTQKLPISALPKQKCRSSTVCTILVPLDDLPLWFSKPFLFPSIPYLKDLCELLKDLTQHDGKIASTANSKKVRPDTINNLGTVNNLAVIDSRQNAVNQIAISSDNSMSPWSIKHPVTPNKKGGIGERLVDSFFHQHKDLQQLCEMIVDRVTKNFSETMSQSRIPPIFRNGASSFEEYFYTSPSMTLDEYIGLLKGLEADAIEEAMEAMKNDFRRIIQGSLQLLAPPETKPQIVEIASSLAINHATEKGNNTICSIISTEKKQFVEEFIRKEKKVKAGVPLTSIRKDLSPQGERPQDERAEQKDLKFHSITDLTALLRAFYDLDINSGGRMLESLNKEKAKVMAYMQRYHITAEGSHNVVEFELQILSLLKEFFSNPSDISIRLLQASIEVVDVLSLLGKLGYAGSSKEDLESLLCNASNILTLIAQVNNTEPPSNPICHENIANFLSLLVEGTLLSHQTLEKALMDSLMDSAKMSQDANIVSIIVLNKLAVSQAGTINAANRPVMMIRLEKMLERHQPK